MNRLRGRKNKGGGGGGKLASEEKKNESESQASWFNFLRVVHDQA